VYKQPSSSKYDYSQPDDTSWHMVLAWLPVKIDGTWYWFIDVMRRRVYDINSAWASYWQYRLPTEADKKKIIDEHTDV
jgi:hypothetical protein